MAMVFEALLGLFDVTNNADFRLSPDHSLVLMIQKTRSFISPCLRLAASVLA